MADVTPRLSKRAELTDAEVRDLARRYRRESVATLIACCRDRRAPASARTAAATKLLEYSDGRPSQARQIAAADLDAMSDEDRMGLLYALWSWYNQHDPGFLRQLLITAYNKAMDELGLLARPGALPQGVRPNRFTRGEPKSLPAHVVPPRERPAPEAELAEQPEQSAEPAPVATASTARAAPTRDGNGGIHPDVVRRFDRPQDITFSEYRRWRQ